jgi:hypothetical protein
MNKQKIAHKLIELQRKECLWFNRLRELEIEFGYNTPVGHYNYLDCALDVLGVPVEVEGGYSRESFIDTYETMVVEQGNVAAFVAHVTKSVTDIVTGNVTKSVEPRQNTPKSRLKNTPSS